MTDSALGDGATGEPRGRYTAKEAGDFELRMVRPRRLGGRQWLWARRSTCVSRGCDHHDGSYVAGVDALLKEPVTAGDVIQLRPQLRDQFHNASAADWRVPRAHRGPRRRARVELKTLKGPACTRSRTR